MAAELETTWHQRRKGCRASSDGNRGVEQGTVASFFRRKCFVEWSGGSGLRGPGRCVARARTLEEGASWMDGWMDDWMCTI